MGDVTLDEIVEASSCITNKIVEYLEQFFHLLKEFEKEYLNSDNLDINEFIECSNDVEQWQKDNIQNINKTVDKNINYLAEIQEESEQLKKARNEVVTDITKNEKEIKHLRQKILNTNKKKENLMEKRDKVQICKLLTNTSFCYKGSNISGYVVGQLSHQVDYFDLDQENLSKQVITNHLYSTIKKVSGNVLETD